MRHDKLIEQLGGYRQLAEKLGRHPSTVFKWRANGIPRDLWPDVLKLARRRRVAGVSYTTLFAGHPIRKAS